MEVFIVPWYEIPGALLGDGLWAQLRPGSTKDNFASTEMNERCTNYQISSSFSLSDNETDEQ